MKEGLLVYSTLLSIHSILRWLVIATGVIALVASLRAASDAAYRPASAPRLLFVTAIDLQVLVGLLLYLRFSPLTTTALHHLDAAMSNHVLRFWVVEHPFGMLASLALAHVGNVRLRQAGGDRRAARRVAVYFAMALLLAIVSIPWPFLSYGRPLL